PLQRRSERQRDGDGERDAELDGRGDGGRGHDGDGQRGDAGGERAEHQDVRSAPAQQQRDDELERGGGAFGQRSGVEQPELRAGGLPGRPAVLQCVWGCGGVQQRGHGAQERRHGDYDDRNDLQQRRRAQRPERDDEFERRGRQPRGVQRGGGLDAELQQREDDAG